MSATETASADVQPEITVEKSDATAPVSSDAAEAAAPVSGNSASRRMSRFVVLALAMTIAAAAGSIAGAMAGAALVRPATAAPDAADPSILKDTIAKLSAEIAGLKSAFEASSKSSSTQITKMSERLERAEKAQAEPASRLAKLSDAVERLEKKQTNDITGSIVEKQQARPPVVPGWALREIYDGRALVESRFGIFEVGPGSPLPGVGRVEAIRKQDGRWVVVTPKGVIASSRY